jgi:Na+-driven multidrug efflux pump
MSVAAARTRELLQAPVLPTLFRLATPNVIGLFATTVVIGYDGYILGRLGADVLAGSALVFPLSMLMTQVSAGGIGGAVTAAVARALGGGRRDEANALAQQALLIACALALVFMLVMLGGGRAIYAAMGGAGPALDAALAYSGVIFSGAVVIWLTNVLAAIVRGAGNMVLPSLLMVASAVLHLLLCPSWSSAGGRWSASASLARRSACWSATCWSAPCWQPTCCAARGPCACCWRAGGRGPTCCA